MLPAEQFADETECSSHAVKVTVPNKRGSPLVAAYRYDVRNDYCLIVKIRLCGVNASTDWFEGMFRTLLQAKSATNHVAPKILQPLYQKAIPFATLKRPHSLRSSFSSEHSVRTFTPSLDIIPHRSIIEPTRWTVLDALL